jgi:hypothetical protein
MTGNTNTARLKRLGLGAAASVGLLALWPAPSIAAPMGGVADVRIPSAVTQVGYQCWWADGDRHCANLNVPAAPREYGDYHYHRPYYRHYGYYDYHSYDRPYFRYRRIKRPEAYWTGSRRWWKSMDVHGRTGNQN